MENYEEKYKEMTQEEKQLLLKDLCTRLPYDVIVSTEDGDEFFIGIEYGESFLDKDIVDKTSQFTTEKFGGQRFIRDIEEIKPYLRPMSSMTEEERNEYFDFRNQELQRVAFAEVGRESAIAEISDWLLTHHFDYRGLIEKGLAHEAPEGMYKIR